jgi:hypothetical protein
MHKTAVSSERRRLHRAVSGVSASGGLVRIPANAVVIGLGASARGSFHEVLYDGRVLRIPETDFSEASAVCDSLPTSRRSRGV